MRFINSNRSSSSFPFIQITFFPFSSGGVGTYWVKLSLVNHRSKNLILFYFHWGTRRCSNAFQFRFSQSGQCFKWTIVCLLARAFWDKSSPVFSCLHSRTLKKLFLLFWINYLLGNGRNLFSWSTNANEFPLHFDFL